MRTWSYDRSIACLIPIYIGSLSTTERYSLRILQTVLQTLKTPGIH